MKTFVSYAWEEGAVAQEIALALREEGHEVFLDRSELREGHAYNARIREAIRDCDLFVFLVSPHAVSEGRYTQTELKFAEEKWPSPAGHVLPVMVRPTTSETIPAYLRAVVMLRPGGSVAAEVVAAVARMSSSRPIQIMRRYAAGFGLVAALLVLGAAFAIFRGWQYQRACGEASRLAQAGTLQHDAGDYAAAWDRYAGALALCPSSSVALDGQVRLAMDWLDNIRVTAGKETFTDIVNKVLPVLSRRAVCVNGRQAADALAHIGWADFLKSREGAGGLDPVHYYRQALERDPGNPYAHAMWGHHLVQSEGSIEEVKSRFRLATASGQQRPFVRRMELFAFLWRRDPRMQEEVIRIADEMRTQGEPLPPATKDDSFTWRIWDVYYERLISGEEKDRFLQALPVANHLATFQWLFPEKMIPESKRHLYLSMLAQLEERKGDRAAALAAYQSLVSMMTASGTRTGRVLESARQAINRLQGK